MKFGTGTMNSTILNESWIQQVDDTVGLITIILHDQKVDLKALERWKVSILAFPRKLDLSSTDAKYSSAHLTANGKTPVFACFLNFDFMSLIHFSTSRLIVNNAGVARFNNIGGFWSQITAGKRVDDDWKEIQLLSHKPHVVMVEGVVQSLRLKSIYLHPDFKTLVAATAVNNNKQNFVKKTSIPEPNDRHKEDIQMAQQYLTTHHFEGEEDDTLERKEGFFSGLTFRLAGLDADSVSMVWTEYQPLKN